MTVPQIGPRCVQAQNSAGSGRFAQRKSHLCHPARLAVCHRSVGEPPRWASTEAPPLPGHCAPRPAPRPRPSFSLGSGSVLSAPALNNPAWSCSPSSHSAFSHAPSFLFSAALTRQQRCSFLPVILPAHCLAPAAGLEASLVTRAPSVNREHAEPARNDIEALLATVIFRIF